MEGFLILSALVLLLMVAAAPAAPREETKVVAIENRTGESVRFEVKDTGGIETIFLGAWQSVSRELVLVEQYVLSYEACDRMNRDAFIVAEDTTLLVLGRCGEWSWSHVQIDNKTGQPMIVSLSGAAGVFGYWLPLGGSSIQIPSGPYTFTSVACLSESGTIKA